MDAITKIAEERIRKAIDSGELDNLPGAGKPLNFEDESWVPEDLRLVYKVLKNAGCIPPELELNREILNLKDLINTIDDDRVRLEKIRELNFKIMKLSMMRKRPLNFGNHPHYEQRIFEKLTG